MLRQIGSPQIIMDKSESKVGIENEHITMVGQLVPHPQSSVGETLNINQPVVTIGRDASCNIVIDHGSVSRKQLRIEVKESGHLIESLSQTTLLQRNGRTLDVGQQHTLNNGDRLEFGKLNYQYVIVNDENGENSNRGSSEGKNVEFTVVRQSQPLGTSQEGHIDSPADVCTPTVDQDTPPATIISPQTAVSARYLLTSPANVEDEEERRLTKLLVDDASVHRPLPNVLGEMPSSSDPFALDMSDGEEERQPPLTISWTELLMRRSQRKATQEEGGTSSKRYRDQKCHPMKELKMLFDGSFEQPTDATTPERQSAPLSSAKKSIKKVRLTKLGSSQKDNEPSSSKDLVPNDNEPSSSKASETKKRRAESATPKRKKSTRASTATQQYRILLSSSSFERHQQLKKTIKELNGEVVMTAETATHFVANKLNRTMNLLSAVAKGLPVVTSEWIDESQKEKRFKDPSAYILRDLKAESERDFVMTTVLAQATKAKLLDGYKVFITATPLNKHKGIEALIESAGGQVLSRVPLPSEGGGVLVLSCAQDVCDGARSLSSARHSGVPIVDVECLLAGILSYRIDVDKYAL